MIALNPKYNYKPSTRLFQALQVPKKLKPSEWAEANIIIPKGVSDRPGKLRLQPWWKSIIDSFDNRELINRYIESSAQQGKSTAMAVSLLYGVFYREQPAMIIFPNEESGIRFFRRVLIKIIEASPNLMALMSPEKSDLNKYELVTNAGILLRIGWAGSASSLASTPAAFVVCDEVNKYREHLTSESDPVSLAKDRMLSFMKSGPAFICASTPTDENGMITKLVGESLFHEWAISCPKCQTEHNTDFGQLDWDHKVSVSELENTYNAIQWKCPICATMTNENDFRILARQGRWKIGDGQDQTTKSRQSCGWKLNGIMSETVPWMFLVKDMIESKHDIMKMRNWKNSLIGIPFTENRVIIKQEYLDNLKSEDYYCLHVPQDCMEITIGLDLGRRDRDQIDGKPQYHYWLVALAIMPDNQYMVCNTNYLLGDGALLDYIANTEYKKPDGSVLMPTAAFIDSRLDTFNVYNFCATNPGFLPIMGMSNENSQGVPIRERVVDTIKGQFGARKDLIAAVTRHDIATNYFKDQFHQLMENGQWHFCSGLNPELYQHIQSEVKVSEKKRGVIQYVYKLRYSGISNHLLDSLIYAAALAWKRGLYKYKTYQDWEIANGIGIPQPYSGPLI